MFDSITSTSPRKEQPNKSAQDAPDNITEIPTAYIATPQPKPGVDGLPMVTLLGAIIVGIIMWIGIFAFGFAVLNWLF